jgi:DNA-binding winged helix-turn-helix (wHTH) protein/tetratricopeptide (TPR) repeat protein
MDVARAELRKAGIPLKLHPQPFRVLLLLIERAGEPVSRDEIQRSLWGHNHFVDFDGGINFCVRQIRAALADDAENPTYIETLPRKGYRFIYPLSPSHAREHDVIPISGPDPVPSPSLATSQITVDSSSSPAAAVLLQPVSPAQALPARSKKLRIALAVVSAVALLAAVAFFYFHRAPKLTEKDTVVLADFNNSTGDPVFDETLKEGLAAGLAQSPYLNLLSDQKIRQPLAFMGRPANSLLTPDIARELCLRGGSKLYLSGSIQTLGNQYVLGLRAIGCQNGDVLGQQQVTANRKEEVLKALDSAATSLRKQVGESRASIEKFDLPIQQATTTSLDALRAYGLGRESLLRNTDLSAAIPLFQEAIRLDPNFALAYAALANTYVKLGESDLALENTRKSYELRDRVSQRERYYIEAGYEFTVGDPNKSLQIYELLSAIYPADPVPVDHMGAIYRVLGQPEKRLQTNLAVLRMDPQNAGAAYGVANSYLTTDRLEDARTFARNALQNNLDSYGLRHTLYQVAFLQNDSQGMTEQVAWAVGKQGIETQFLSDSAYSEAYSGRMRKVTELWRRAEDAAVAAGQQESAMTARMSTAIADAQVGNLAEARRVLSSFSSRPLGYNAQLSLGMAWALAGDPARAENLARQSAQDYGGKFAINEMDVSVLRAAIALVRRDGQKSIELLRSSSPYELGSDDRLYSAYLRGQAFLQLHKGDEAAAEFQKILEHPGIVGNDTIGALAHLQLARAYALQHDAAKAHVAYESFLSLWSGADSDLPLLHQAKSELSSLR